MNPLAAVLLADIGGLLLLPIGMVALAFWIWMLVDCARHETGSGMVAWLLLILFFGIIGAPFYFFLRRQLRRHKAQLLTGQPLYQPWRKDQRIG